MRSNSGWSRATRSLVEIMAPHFSRVYVVDLFYHPNRAGAACSYEQITDGELYRLVDHTAGSMVVLHACSPEHFRRFWGATNIGYFFWETNRFPSHLNWGTSLQLMDLIWVPTEWQRDVLSLNGFTGPVRVVPWPHAPFTEQRRVATSRIDTLPVYPVCSDQALRAIRAVDATFLQIAGYRQFRTVQRTAAFLYQLKKTAVERSCGRYRELRRDADVVLLSIQNDAARKGLALLVSEWLDYLRTAKRRPMLLVKYGSLNVWADVPSLHYGVSTMVRALMRRAAVDDSRIFFTYANLDEGQLAALYGDATALVTATMGEGFGGPIAEALCAGTPVVAPVHTGCSQILRSDYPLAIESERHTLALWRQLPVYSPSSSWFVPAPGALAGRLRQVEAMSAAQLQGIVAAAQEGLRVALSPQAVAAVVQSEFANLRVSNGGLVSG
jgi:glycosyltransferase involved in cell wall biosynthesis